MIDALIALSDLLEQREVRHDVHPPPLPYISVLTNDGRYVGRVEHCPNPGVSGLGACLQRGYYWRRRHVADVEKAALVIALDVINAELERSPRRSGRTPRAHHR